jgi:hypothetical protein
MKEYYLERVKTIEIQIGLATLGLAQKKMDLAKKLADVNINDIGEVVKELAELNNAFEDLKKDLEYSQDLYRQECEKSGGVV